MIKASKLLEILNSRKRTNMKEIDACMARLGENLKKHTEQFSVKLSEQLKNLQGYNFNNEANNEEGNR